MKVQLTTDDKRLGKFDEIGAAVPPALAVDGSAYEMVKCSKFYIVQGDTRYFVVVPVSVTEPLEIEWVNADPSFKALKPAAKAVKVDNDGQS